MGLQKLDALPPTKGQPEDGLGNWHANLIYIERRKCVLFANNKTLFNFLSVGLKRSEIQELDTLFCGHLMRALEALEVDKGNAFRVLEECSTVDYAKSNDRSVLGSMNDLAYNYKTQIRLAGGLHRADMSEVTRLLNDMPMSAIGYGHSRAALLQVYE